MSGPASIRIPSEAGRDLRLEAHLLGRSYGYGLLARFFRHPAIGRGRKELQGTLKTFRTLFKVSNKNSWEQQVKEIQRLLSRFSEADQISEYEYCFGHTAHSKTSPYELEYGEEHSHRQPQELADISAFYQAFGIQVSESAHERADHIAVECEFMHFLLFKQCRALGRGEQDHASICEEAAKMFLAEHLARWLPAFAFQLSKFSKSNLFRAIAEFSAAFIYEECQIFKISAGDRNLPVKNVEENVEAGCVSCQWGPIQQEKGMPDES